MYVLAYVGIMANNMAIPAMGCLGYPCNGLPRLYPCNGLPTRLPRIIGSLPLKRIPRAAATMFRCTINTSESTTNTSTRCHRAHLDPLQRPLRQPQRRIRRGPHWPHLLGPCPQGAAFQGARLHGSLLMQFLLFISEVLVCHYTHT